MTFEQGDKRLLKDMLLLKKTSLTPQKYKSKTEPSKEKYKYV